MSHPIPPISHRFDSFRYVSYFRYVSRVHIADISRSLIASMLEPSEYAFEAIYNLADDEPAPRAEVMAFAGGLLALPPLEPVGAKRRESTGNLKMVDNYRMRNELLKGEELSFPSYREGLRQLYGEKIRCAAEKEEEAETTAADAETAETAETASAERAPEVRRRMGEGVGDGEGVVGALRRELGRRDPGGCGLCGVVGSHSAALQSATAAESAEAWFEEWHESLAEWLMATPYGPQLGECFGAFGIHLLSRFDQWLALNSRGRSSRPSDPPPPLDPQCEWIGDKAREGELHLPEFPEWGDSAPHWELPLAPAPRLLPRILPRTLEQLLDAHARLPPPARSAGKGTTWRGSSWSATVEVSDGLAGAAVGAIIVLALAAARRARRGAIRRAPAGCNRCFGGGSCFGGRVELREAAQ